MNSDNDIKEKRKNDIRTAIMNLLQSSTREGAQFVTFYLGEEEYGIPIKYVQEILAYRETTHLPNTKVHVRGILNLRGTVVPVMDLRSIFGLPLLDKAVTPIIAIVKIGGKSVGLIVDRISDVLTIEKSNIDDMPDVSLSINASFVQSIGKIGERFLILLNVEQVMGSMQGVEL